MHNCASKASLHVHVHVLVKDDLVGGFLKYIVSFGNIIPSVVWREREREYLLSPARTARLTET